MRRVIEEGDRRDLNLRPHSWPEYLKALNISATNLQPNADV